MYKLLVTGCRFWTAWKVIRASFRDLPKDTIIVHGACEGADELADNVAKSMGFTTRPYKALWTTFGKRAGPIRNSTMLSMEHNGHDGFPINDCFAYHDDLPNSKGTKDMVKKAYAANIRSTVFTSTSTIYTYAGNL
jgi:hypothetical protein